MIVVRNVFVAKPGQASKLAAQVKKAAASVALPNHRVLTDVTGAFNRVVLEYEVENMAAFEKNLGDTMANEVFREEMAGYTDLYQDGTREMFRVV